MNDMMMMMMMMMTMMMMMMMMMMIMTTVLIKITTYYYYDDASGSGAGFCSSDGRNDHGFGDSASGTGDKSLVFCFVFFCEGHL